jgi:hypothetical protein
MNKNNIAALILVVGVLAAGIWYVKFGPKRQTDIGLEGAKAKVTDFIEKNLVQPGTKVDVTGASLENGLYKVSIKVGTQSVDTYMTKDGSKFFPEAIDIAEAEKKATDTNTKTGQTAKNEPAPKSDVPDVNLFVMSYCPYGTQAEKGILPVLDALGKKINFSLRFVSYAMHDKKELDENLRQYCIQKSEPTKLNSYLTCFLKKGQGTEASCMTSAGVTASKISSCVAQADAQFNVTKNYNDKSTYQGNYPPFDVDKADNEKYGVQGSPTLVINGQEVSAGRDSASILKTICDAFNNPPAECQTQLSSTAPAAGFGEGSAPAANNGAPGVQGATPGGSCGN